MNTTFTSGISSLKKSLKQKQNTHYVPKKSTKNFVIVVFVQENNDNLPLQQQQQQLKILEINEPFFIDLW